MGAISLAAIGEKLRTAREKKGVTLDQAQRQTHIHSTVLSALEGGRSDEVLTPTYVKSFLKKYSSYLGLDPSQMIKEYSMLHPDSDSLTSGLAGTGTVLKNRRGLSGYWRTLGRVFFIAVCVFSLVMIARGAVRFIKAHYKPSVGKSYAQIKKPRAVSAKQPQKKAADKPQNQQISIPDNEQITLMMKVKAEVYVGAKRDGVLLFRRLIPKGTIETLTADQKLNISIAKAKSVELVLNGHPLDIINKAAIKDLEITRKSIKVK